MRNYGMNLQKIWLRGVWLAPVLCVATVPFFRTVSGANPPAGSLAPEVANTPDVALDASPLGGADTTSPRATLRTFLTNAKAAIRGWERDQGDKAAFYAFRRAAETLDFRDTTDGDLWSVKAVRVLLLKELLDRIALPPDDEIPGWSDVSRDPVRRWTIPGTRISVARIDAGPRAGDYLFSSRTVERLERLYQDAKDLPYQPGATPGAYDFYLASERASAAQTAMLRGRLKPIDTTNPRATLQGFVDVMNRAYEMVVKADAALRASPPGITLAEAREVEAEANVMLARAVQTLNLRDVPAALQADVGMETALQLKEIIDRVPLPSIESVPDAQAVAALRLADPDAPARWRLPSTEVEIVQVLDGDRAGDFLFSPATVARADQYFNLVADLPYRIDWPGFSNDWASSAVSPGFYEFYITTPGYLVPGIDFLSQWVDKLPPALKVEYRGHTLWQWAGLFLCILGVAVIGVPLFYLTNRFASRRRNPLQDWLRILPPILVAGIVTATLDFIDHDLNITGRALTSVSDFGAAIVIGMIALAAFWAFLAGAETILKWRHKLRKGMDANLIRVAARLLGLVAAAYIVVAGARRVGADLVPLLAGLGVGGLAVALAAQKTLANFIGSLILFASQPVREGDQIYLDNQRCTVENIGLHSTRLRTLERSVITIPNATFSELQLNNLTQRDRRLVRTLLQLRYETTPDQMRYVLVKLRELLLGHPMVTPDPARVRFIGYGAYSKDVEVFAYLRCRNENDFLAVQEDVLLRMEEIVDGAGTGFAFPSQTAYLARDAGLDAEQGSKSEKDVANWRSEGRLPFPEFRQEDRMQLKDTLDYPPKGSPEAKT
jgi:MscS family membrane protein